MPESCVCRQLVFHKIMLQRLMEKFSPGPKPHHLSLDTRLPDAEATVSPR